MQWHIPSVDALGARTRENPSDPPVTFHHVLILCNPHIYALYPSESAPGHFVFKKAWTTPNNVKPILGQDISFVECG